MPYMVMAHLLDAVLPIQFKLRVLPVAIVRVCPIQKNSGGFRRSSILATFQKGRGQLQQWVLPARVPTLVLSEKLRGCWKNRWLSLACLRPTPTGAELAPMPEPPERSYLNKPSNYHFLFVSNHGRTPPLPHVCACQSRRSCLRPFSMPREQQSRCCHGPLACAYCTPALPPGTRGRGGGAGCQGWRTPRALWRCRKSRRRAAAVAVAVSAATERGARVHIVRRRPASVRRAAARRRFPRP